MNIVFYIFLTATAIYSILNIGNFIKWYWSVIQFVPVKIWNLIKKIFGR